MDLAQQRGDLLDPHQGGPGQVLAQDLVEDGARPQFTPGRAVLPYLHGVLELQEQLTTTENQVSFSRQHYNASVLDYNTTVATVPNNFIAGMFGFKARDYFEADEGAKEAPKVKF